ncbi:hypothetical protein PENTCL1PPCAC_5434, partial [Pristionchus entomophagus]
QNGNRWDEDIGGFKLKRRVDDLPEAVYSIPNRIVIRAGEFIKICTRSREATKYGNNIIVDGEPTWDVGCRVETSLVDQNGVVIAMCTMLAVGVML